MAHWVMVIDLDCCIGCKACILACSQANCVPEGMWRKFSEVAQGPPPERKRLLATRSCMHCEDPPCKAVCPTGATYQRDDGIVGIDEEKCVGCGYCILACPYDARTIHRYQHSFDAYGISENEQVKASADLRAGICTKCNFCMSKIESGLKNNFQPGVDSDATPSCVLACSCGALHFGDLDDPDSAVSQLLKNRKACRPFTGVETRPSVYYLVD